MTIKIELSELERQMNLLFDLVSQRKITEEEYDKLAAYSFRRKNELKNELERMGVN